jgi:hypothetical protein
MPPSMFTAVPDSEKHLVVPGVGYEERLPGRPGGVYGGLNGRFSYEARDFDVGPDFLAPPPPPAGPAHASMAPAPAPVPQTSGSRGVRGQAAVPAPFPAPAPAPLPASLGPVVSPEGNVLSVYMRLLREQHEAAMFSRAQMMEALR